MTCSRHWYILPLLVNLTLVFSASLFVKLIAHDLTEEISFTIPMWMLFATVAIWAPPSLAITRTLLDPAITVAIGGILSSAGLLCAWFVKDFLQMLSLCAITGAGISLSFQAIGVSLSPYFIRERATAPFFTLLLSATVMMFLNPLLELTAAAQNNNIFLWYCLVVFIISLLPIMAYLHSVRSSKIKQEKILHEEFFAGDFVAFSEILKSELDKNDAVCCDNAQDISYCDNVRCDFSEAPINNEWALSIMAILIWITWGAGVDTTWLSLGWHHQYFETPIELSALQLFMCLVLLTIKMYVDLSQRSISVCRVNLASNYMQLGLLGTGGMILCLLPENTSSFHNNLLFTAGCALQFDDLSNLCLVRNSGLLNPVFSYRLISYQIYKKIEHDNNSSPELTLFNKICHMFSLFLISLLSIILGIQIANILGFLSTLPPLSFIISRPGLMVMSVAAVCISLMRPNLWKRQKHVVVL